MALVCFVATRAVRDFAMLRATAISWLFKTILCSMLIVNSCAFFDGGLRTTAAGAGAGAGAGFGGGAR